jgi:hypothetical protein
MEPFAWASPIGLGVFLAGVGILMWGLSQGRKHLGD